MEASNMQAMREALEAIDKNTDLIDIAEDIAQLENKMLTEVEKHGFNPALGMRAALLIARSYICGTSDTPQTDILVAIDAALDSPPRNCDVGTVDDQVARFESYCKSYYKSHHQDCRGCKFYDPMHMGLMCLARWEQDSCDETQEKSDPAHSTDHGELIAGEPR